MSAICAATSDEQKIGSSVLTAGRLLQLAAVPIFIVLAVALALPACADEPLFGFIYATDLLPQNKWEAEQWVTLREGRSQGDFTALQTRTELSYGVTSYFQLSGYVNFAYASAYHNSPSGETVPPEIFADYPMKDPNALFSQFRFESVSLEAIVRVLSPYTDPFGLAFYVEPSVGPRTFELENRVILQKNFFNDQLVVAFNATLGFEWRLLPGDKTLDPTEPDFKNHWDQETDVNFGLGVSYRFIPNWSLGVEFQNEREWAGLNPFNSSKATNVAWYLGPTLHYGGQRFFATLTALFQLPMAQDWANKWPDSLVVRGITNADDFENFRIRLKVGFFFN